MNKVYSGIINLFFLPYRAPTRNTSSHVEQNVLELNVGHFVNRVPSCTRTIRVAQMRQHKDKVCIPVRFDRFAYNLKAGILHTVSERSGL